MLYNSDNFFDSSYPGILSPFSHLRTVDLSTFIFSATCSCVISAFTLAAAKLICNTLFFPFSPYSRQVSSIHYLLQTLPIIIAKSTTAAVITTAFHTVVNPIATAKISKIAVKSVILLIFFIALYIIICQNQEVNGAFAPPTLGLS